MPSEFSSNIREIAAELKLMDKKFAASVRKAIRVTVVEAGEGTLKAIKAKASEQGLVKADSGTKLRVSFSVRSGGAKISTSQKIARYARPLEKGSKGSGGGYNRHPVFGTKTFVNQPVRPFFYGPVAKQEKISEEKLIAAVDVAVRATGFYGI